MIRAYSQRLLPPFSGVVQIAESERIRAQSFDGINWDIQYVPEGGESDGSQRIRGYALDRGYYEVASLKRGELQEFIFPKFLDHDEVSAGIHELKTFISAAKLPFAFADIFEYWLLDAVDGSPLALIYSCCDESLMETFPVKNEWTALPHSKLNIENTENEQIRNEPPVNHRLQHMIANRAGHAPKAQWFRRGGDVNGFPSLMVKEDWSDPIESDICQRYLMRKAPRLLMLNGLSFDERERLEVAAKQHVFEVEQYFKMYPVINDEPRMKAMRVEAQLRRTAPQVTSGKDKKRVTVNTELSKDMRIIEN